MIRTLPSSKTYKIGYTIFIALFYVFLFAPLIVTCVLAFNNSNFPTLPWKGFTLDWFFANNGQRVGVFEDSDLLSSMYISFETGFYVSVMSLIVGTMGAFLFVQEKFRFKGALYFLALAPLVIPGVILGISILLSSTIAGGFVDQHFGIDIPFLRPSFSLVVLGQFSFITTFVVLVVSAKLKKFDGTLEEAALNLGASRFDVIRLITLPYLKPALIGSFIVSFLMSFGNFNTTLFLVGSDTTLPIDLYSRIRDGSTPVLNAVSFLLIFGTSLLAVFNLIYNNVKNKE